MQPPAWAGAFVGIPYRDFGRGRDACDCWGLVRLVLRERAGIDLPAYCVAPDDVEAVQAAIAGERVGPWQRVAPDDVRPLDVVEMTAPARVGGRVQFAPLHVGVIVGGGWLLHSERHIGSALVRLADKAIARRIEGIWRHVA